jgi:hypothetical protein
MRSFLLTVFLIGCGDTGQKPVSYPLIATGTTGPFAAGAWEVTLDVAQVALGPIYFCATEAASMDLCPAAVNEFADVAQMNALDPAEQTLGRVEGVTGEIRSATYDFGVTWFNRQTSPQASAKAPGGHSAHFEGSATRGATTLRFVSDVDVIPPQQGTLAVQGARMVASVHDSRQTLRIAIDPGAWWSDVDFDELAALSGDPVVVTATSRAHNALVLRMTTVAMPSFDWSFN